MAASLVRRCLPNPYSVYAATNQTIAVDCPQIRPRCQFEQVIKRGKANDCFRGKERYDDSSFHVRNVCSIAIGIALGVGALCIGCNRKNREKWFQAARCDNAQEIKSTTQGGNNPRTGYLGWDEYFMAVAFLSAQRSKDPRTQVGACITNQENKIVGIGYNGMPNGCKDNELPWGKSKDWLESKSPYVCHAELNAVLNKNSASVKDCKIYVALFPCNECAKVIIQSGIREVIYYSDKYSEKPKMKASRRLFNLAGVKCRQFIPRERQITIDFSSIDPDVQLD